MRRPAWFSAGFLYYLLFIIVLFLPIALLVIFAFNDSTKLTFPLRGFTTEHFADLMNNREVLQAVRTSIVLGVVSSLVATLLGTMGAIAVVRFDFPGKGAFMAASALPLVIPYVILGVSLLLLFNVLDISLSAWTAGLAHIVISIPYALLVVTSRLAGFPRNLEEAAMDLGSTYWGALFRITLPITLPALIASFLICFTISFDEFAISSFLVGTEPTLPVYLYSQLRFPTRLPLVVALSAILMVGSIVIIILSEWLRRLGQSRVE